MASRGRRPRLVWLALAWLVAACAGAPPPPDITGPATHNAYVVSNGWHTGIVLARDGLPPGLLPEAEDFADAPYLEFGWGDRAYYPAKDPGMGATLAAALLPTRSVMHVAGLDRPPRTGSGGTEAVAILLTAAQRDRLAAGIDAGFDRPEGGRAAAGPGLYPDSLFYPARGRFHMFNTCNSWTARQLAAAGVPVSPAGVITAESLMRQLREPPTRTPATHQGTPVRSPQA